MGKASAPPTPDYKGAAEATAAGNRINQNTPWGSLSYQQSGTDAQGNPTYTANTTLSPEQQQLLSQNTSLQTGLLGTAQSGLGQVAQALSNPAIDNSKLAAMPINPGETYTDASMRLMQPYLHQQQSDLDTRLANQGVTQGSEAYGRDQMALKDQQDRAALQAIQTGIGQDMTARQQGIQEQAYVNQYPLNVVNALRTGNQVTGPQFQNTQGLGANYSGALGNTYGAQLNATNASNAANANFMNGLFGLGGAAILSDIRLKRDIERIGTHARGFGVYKFRYLDSDLEHIGVMAQEVEPILPEAVLTGPDGYKMVHYGML
jgi:hypothetical protein